MIDLDNTIGDRDRAVRAWVHEFCDAHALPAGAAEWIVETDNDGYSARGEVFNQIRNRFGLEPHASVLIQTYRERVVELTTPIAGALDALAELRADGHVIAIVTNGDSGPQRAKIDKLGIADMVDLVLISGDIDIKKPNPAIFHAAAKATGLPLRGSWMIGDAPVNDVVGGSAVGARTAWLHRGREWPSVHAPPTLILDDLRPLAAAIRNAG